MQITVLGLELRLDVTPKQLTEILAWSVVTSCVALGVQSTGKALKAGKERGGTYKSTSLVTGWKAYLTPAHAMLGAITVLAPVILAPWRGFHTPILPNRFALPLPYGGDVHPHTWVEARLISGTILCGLATYLTRTAMSTLGAAFDTIHVRQNTKSVIETGPFAHIRHPVYASILLKPIGLAALYWNALPAYAAILIGCILAVKIDIEEQILLDDPDLGEQYRYYQKRVPYKLIPYIY
ncbi:uncharacterized protein L969DRAFT_374092 [Mixia osmundae IAM 14324]|uniref:Protein-S-isoprenylcysteine O-methyltransferase n=1 Tax=Mixia osmundae (strain CBS 9802 / IAM 14324 / JCM 22182 / KY 12970) TaxID=764103 RepID=G7DUE8_MIXOS|nr:uncharacterized protein L969DRAFT_374092 [Mixia osmundae IAM 14324]KEI41080.1 hypothetical protein L969DRAFT_374092 [Mixia osmundae IAM 14324]GAA94208.1 hypothetical protein E5Q_00856 [Mixia osmundae IAM 14324]